MKRACALLLLLGAAACGSPEPPRAPVTFPAPSEEPASPLARMTLVAASGSLVPGERTWLGARFEIEPGWHVYGEDPGDAGMPTRVRLELPEGVTAGKVLYPTPKRFVDAGDIVTHGYEREVVLHVPVDVATTVPAGGRVTVRAKGSWLACKDQCVRETGEAVLVMAVGDPQPAPPESAAVFTRFPIPQQEPSTP